MCYIIKVCSPLVKTFTLRIYFGGNHIDLIDAVWHILPPGFNQMNLINSNLLSRKINYLQKKIYLIIYLVSMYLNSCRGNSAESSIDLRLKYSLVNYDLIF